MADFEILGSPSDIRTRVAMMRSQATVYESVATNLSRVAAEGWKGRAADRFRERFSFEPRKWLDAAAGFRVAADALEVFAGALESAQSSAAACAREYARGEEVTRSARAGYEAEVKAGQRKKASWEAAHGPGTFTLTVEPFVDPGEAVRAGAKSVFASVCAQLNAAAETAAAGVRAGCAAAPRERNWLEKAGAFAGSVVSGAGEAVMELAAMADQANPLSWVRDDLMSLASGRFTAEELLASKRMQAEDMMALAKAVRDNPGEFVKQAGAAMIDLDTWRHDPGRALGRLLPDAALTLATAGGGAAARGTRGASRAAKGVEAAGAAVERSSVLSRLSRRVTDVSSCADPIDVATGEVFVSMVDVELPGVLPVVIGRTYSSAYGRGRFFGTTWASSLDEHVEVDAACGAAVFYRADKASLVYQMGGLGEAVSPLVGDAWPLTWLTPQQAEGFGVAGAVCAVFDPGAGVYRVFEADPDAPLVLGRVSGGVPAWVDVDLDAGLSSYRLAAIVDGLGNRIEVSYDEAGVPSVWRHSGGYVVEFAADPSGTRVGQIAVGRDGGRPVVVSRFTYDSAGLVASEAAGEVPADGASQAVTRCGYDAVGRMTWWVDSNGERYDYTYDEAGRCVAGVGSGGTLNSLLEYDADELVTRVQDATGAWWRHEHDGAGHVVAVTDPLGAVTRTTWDERGRRVAVVDAAGGVSSWTYDDAGNVSAVSGPGGRTVRVEYLPGRGLPTRVVGADGAVSGYEYDGRGLLASVTDAAGAVTRLGYDVRGALTSVTDAAGAVTVLECDLAGLPVSVTDGAGRVSWARRDVFGRVVAAGDAAGESAWAYDVAGRLTWRRDADGGVWRYVWDGEGNLVEEVDPVGGLTRHEYGRFDARTASTGPDGARTEFVYDGERRLTSVLDPAGGAWEFERDVAGRVMATVDVNGARTVVERDAVGRVVARVNAAGQRVRFRYDEHGDLVESVTDAPEGMDPVVRCFSYDGAGRLVAADGGGAPVGFARDVLGRVVAEGPAGQLVTSEFDVVGRLVGRVAPSGRRTGWAYDAGGVLAGLSAGVRQVRFGVDGAGREVSRVIDAGVELTSSWSPAGLLQAHGLTGGAPGSAGGFVGVGRSYRYDRAGHLTGLTDAAGGISEFELDPAGRVLAVTTDGVVSERYAYDPTGALSSTYVISDEKQGVSGGGFAKSGSLTKVAGGWHYGYDGAGRVTSRWRHGLSGGRIEWSYAWDGEDRLVRTTGPGDRVWTYTYDGLGRRVGRTRAVAGVVDESRSYVWSGNLLIEQVTRVYEREPVLAGVSAAGVGGGGTDGCVAVVTWDHDPRTGVPLVQRGTPHGGGAGGPGVGPGPVGGSAGWSQDRVDDEFFAIVADLAGAPTELLTPDGDIAWRREASVWGVPGRSGPQGCPLGSLGQVYDEDTGWVYNLHRYYDPVLGGLTAPDPIGIEGGVNPHAGVPNPLTWTDPLGLAGCEAVGKAAEALAGRPAAKTGTVWDDVVGTAGAIPGTGGLPKSFELTAGNSRVWVHGNVTDHLADAARSAARSGQSLEMVGLGTQQRLRSLQAAVGGATRGGVPLNQRMTVGGWELEFRQRAGDALPALIHGRWVG